LSFIYRVCSFDLLFDSTIVADIYPSFAIRSILGSTLKQMACMMPQMACRTCSLNHFCSYAQLFETPVEKENLALPGRNTLPHPYILKTDQGVGASFQKLSVEVTLIGHTTKLAPVLNEVFQRAGKNGLFRQCEPFEVKFVNEDEDSRTFTLGGIDQMQKEPLTLKFLSPTRFKTHQKIIRKPTFNDILMNISRRYDIMSKIYGKPEDLPELTSMNIQKERYLTAWVDLEHYSGRQKRAMKMGGFVGKMLINGSFPTRLLDLLKSASILNLGKNTSFGLGCFSIAPHSTTQNNQQEESNGSHQ
jgi:CRISPR-associated endoribonuclease Cas6